MRKGGKRVPVAAVDRGQGPFDGGRAKALVNHRLVFHIGVVVQIDEATAADAPVGAEGQEDQETGDQQCPAGAGTRLRRCWPWSGDGTWSVHDWSSVSGRREAGQSKPGW